MSYVLTELRFRELTTMPEERVDELMDASPTFLGAQLAAESSKVAARLRKRYPAFFEPVPVIIEQWITRLVTPRCYRRLGVEPNNAQYEDVRDDAKNAESELTEAANSDTGLLELSQNDATDTAVATKGGPFGYSEQSPYTWTDSQYDASLDE